MQSGPSINFAFNLRKDYISEIGIKQLLGFAKVEPYKNATRN
jgi:hypothetical protein